ncbi:hypothetical protein CYLTODRAFT_455369 [Cylindrobasidium torrendii FP15055 ss-10]|uniref:Uncharacterized protein n=1 Tax=Cylindrobasidium torrendii FP15055 ss-10 TaxID=1314674 RepID=A0A0D7B8F1_9AGAR|nr:hypothetical protein CYLTODRAFT_455369 [Cylindrobasidium torrendii FP15055 ss-10]
MSMTWQFINREDAQMLPWASSARAVAHEMDGYAHDMPFPPSWQATKEEISRNSSSKLTTVSSVIDLVMKTVASKVALPASSSTMDEEPPFPPLCPFSVLMTSRTTTLIV